MHLRCNLLVLAAAMLLASRMNCVAGDGLPVQYGLLGLGDLTTTDQGGPYHVPLQQSFEVEAALAAKTGAPGGPFFDRDILNFLANTECLEATFNSYAAFGAGLPNSLTPGEVIGGKRANLSEEVQAWAEEVALDEQGHVRMIRQVLGPDNSVPCPTLNLTGGFRAFMDAATNKTSNPPFDPYANDVNFLLSTFSLEEIGATGDKGCILLVSNPGVANAISGLATSASYQGGIDRLFLWQRRNETVPEYNMTVQEMVMAISNLRDDLDGPPEDDQALLNGNPNFIAVPTRNINLVPTDIRGLTFSRTPQQVLRIVTLAGDDDKGAFFPNGVNGKINSTAGYKAAANGFGGYPGNKVTVRSLAEANNTGLLNNNITKVTPAPPAVQAEASGQEYVKGGSPAPATTTESAAAPAGKSNTMTGMTNSNSASPSPAAGMSAGMTAGTAAMGASQSPSTAAMAAGNTNMMSPSGSIVSSAAPSPAGTDTVGSDTRGSDPVGSDTRGSDPVGSDTKGSDPRGSSSTTASTAGTGADGAGSIMTASPSPAP